MAWAAVLNTSQNIDKDNVSNTEKRTINWTEIIVGESELSEIIAL